MNLGTQKWKKARANFAGVRDDAGRCGVACTRACPWDAQCLPKACSSQGQGSPHGHAAAKAWACSSQGQGSPPWASTQGLGMHAGSPPWARSHPQHKHFSPRGAPTIALSPAHTPIYGPLVTSTHPPTSSHLSKPLMKRNSLAPPIAGFENISPTEAGAGVVPSGLPQPPLSPYASSKLYSQLIYVYIYIYIYIILLFFDLSIRC